MGRPNFEKTQVYKLFSEFEQKFITLCLKIFWQIYQNCILPHHRKILVLDRKKFKRDLVYAEMANYGEKVYIPRNWFSFVQLLRRRILRGAVALRFFLPKDHRKQKFDRTYSKFFPHTFTKEMDMSICILPEELKLVHLESDECNLMKYSYQLKLFGHFEHAEKWCSVESQKFATWTTF